MHARSSGDLDVLGIPIWLPWIYVAASVGIGNIGRRLAELTGDGAPIAADEALVDGNRSKAH